MKRDYTNSAADEWYRSLTGDPAAVPFCFTYDGREYRGFSPAHFALKDRSIHTEAGREMQTLTFGFLDRLEITLILTHYFTHGVTEWTVWFQNISRETSGVMEDLKTELTFRGSQPVLKGILGDHANQYQPYSHELSQNLVEFSADTGRATHITFPYFNLEYGTGGAMLAIGWAGTWHARFASDGTDTVYTAGAVNGMRLRLEPGEKIRSALFVVAPYRIRNEHYAANFWRSWFINHNLPKADATGTDLTPFSTCCLASDTGLPNSDGSISERSTTWRPSLEKMIAEDVKVDFRWFDAGWYVRPDGGSEETDWWGTVGTWELDPVKWPGKTFLESTDFARANGMKTLVWFEPERVTSPEDLAKNFGYDPKWAIRVPEDHTAPSSIGEPGNTVISNNIGDPDCLKWTTDRICRMLRENKVEMYREDNNCNVARLWRYLDSVAGPERKGITECKFIAGHYQMWDDIIACTTSYGGCGFVDSCASGGGRNDLESLRRGIPLLRSDADRTSTALRLSMTSSFNRWIPFCGANTKEKLHEVAITGNSDVYIWRASYLPSLNVDSQFVQDPDMDFDMLRFGLREWKQVAPFLLKEFYPLTPWHSCRDDSDFTAYCYFDPDSERGVLLAFRQEHCVRDTLTVALPFAQGRRCLFTDTDSGQVIQAQNTLSLTFSEPRTARLLWIELH